MGRRRIDFVSQFENPSQTPEQVKMEKMIKAFKSRKASYFKYHYRMDDPKKITVFVDYSVKIEFGDLKGTKLQYEEWLLKKYLASLRLYQLEQVDPELRVRGMSGMLHEKREESGTSSQSSSSSQSTTSSSSSKKLKKSKYEPSNDE